MAELRLPYSVLGPRAREGVYYLGGAEIIRALDGRWTGAQIRLLRRPNFGRKSLIEIEAWALLNGLLRREQFQLASGWLPVGLQRMQVRLLERVDAL